MDIASFNDKKVLLSEFNEASYQIARLNVIWSMCNTESRKGNLSEWKWLLDRGWIELSPDAYKKDKKKYSLRNKIVNLKISNAKDRQEFYNALQEKEIFLRNLQDDVGKGSKRSESYEGIM